MKANFEVVSERRGSTSFSFTSVLIFLDCSSLPMNQETCATGLVPVIVQVNSWEIPWVTVAVSPGVYPYGVSMSVKLVLEREGGTSLP